MTKKSERTVTVDMPEDTYNFLVELARKMQLQDNRGTRGPVAFIIRHKVEKDTREGCEDYFVYYDTENCETHTAEELFNDEFYFEDFKSNLDLDFEEDELPNEITWENSGNEFIDWLEDCIEFDKIPCIKEWEDCQGTFFLTAEAAQAHLDSNRYHYKEDAMVYGIHVWRNPELEKLLFTVCGFAPQPYQPDLDEREGANHAYGPMLNKMPKIEKSK